jgi:hypothetical protein
MTEQEAFQQAAIIELQRQRDEFANRLANAAGEIQVLRMALEQIKQDSQKEQP